MDHNKGIIPSKTTPIICICNKITDKKMTEIKKKSLVLKMSKPNNNQLLELAKKICLNEKINVDDIFLNKLVIKSQNDFRKIISSLEYLFITNKSNTLNLDNLVDLIDEKKIDISFALGKSYEDLKDYEKAFSFFNEGNDLRFNKFGSNLENEKKIKYINLKQNDKIEIVHFIGGG